MQLYMSDSNRKEWIWANITGHLEPAKDEHEKAADTEVYWNVAMN